MEDESNVPNISAGAGQELQPTALSKNARKKAAKAEKFAAYKLEKRAKEKNAKREKKRVEAEKRKSGEIFVDEIQRKKKRRRLQCEWKGRVIVDLGFDDLMSEKEITSLSSQLAYTHSANRNAGFPFSLLFTGFTGRLLERMEKMNEAGYKRWDKTEWWNGGYEKLWAENPTGEPSSDTKAEVESEDNRSSGTEKNSVVYLTADSEHELEELKEDETYVIGGIVDHNRYKNLCENKAVKQGVRTARLPIGTFLAELPTRKVLTVNQVFEILVKWAETRNWEESLYSVVPKRKFQKKDQTGHDQVEDEGFGDQGVDLDDRRS